MQELTVDVLACARLTRLLRRDAVTKPVRERLVAAAYGRRSVRAPHPSHRSWQDHALMDRDAPKVAVLLECPWCVSVWVAAGVVAARRWAPAVWDPVARGLAASYVTGALAGRYE